MKRPDPATLSRARVITVGDIMLDRYWFGEVSRISPEAPVPVVNVARVEERLGGAANVARNVAALGAHSMLVGVVGADEPAARIHELLAEGDVESHLQVDAELATTIKLRVIGRQQQLLRIDFEHRPSHDVLEEKSAEFAALVPGVPVVVFSDYGKGGLDHIAHLIELARDGGATVLVDPKGVEYARYRGAHIVTPNRAELRDVVGGWSDETQLAAKTQALLQDLGLQALLLTRAEEGMTLFRLGQPALHVPTQAREVFDVSGAGDTVIATLAVGLAIGAPLEDAVRLSNRAAGIVVGKLGTAVATADELWAAGAVR